MAAASRDGSRYNRAERRHQHGGEQVAREIHCANRDPELMRHLQAEQIPFVSFDGAEFYPGAAAGAHWTPAGHKLVADRILGLLSANNIVQAGVRSE